jgi:hypothetical protein
MSAVARPQRRCSPQIPRCERPIGKAHDNINLGSNRWTFKPELGLSRAWGRAELDAYGCRRTSRVGITSSLPLTRHQSLKLSYAQGAYIRFGGDDKIFSVAWQYSWFDGRATRAAK